MTALKNRRLKTKFISFHRSPTKCMLFLLPFIGTYILISSSVPLIDLQKSLDIVELVQFAVFDYVPSVFWPNENLSEERFVMFRCDHLVDAHACGGWCDRLKGIFSAYWWAKITNRTLIINIKHPCPLTYMLEPNEVYWNRHISTTSDTHLISKMNANRFKSMVSYVDFTRIGQNSRVLILQTNRNLVEAFSRNKIPHIYETIKHSSGIKPELIDMPRTFRSIYNELFRLTPKLQAQFNKFASYTKPNSSTFLICAHIRLGGHVVENHERHPESNDIAFMPRSHIDHFWDFIRDVFLSNVSIAGNFRLFVSTDTPEAKKQAVAKFGADRVAYSFGDAFKHIDFLDAEQCQEAERTFLDFHTFQLCDAALLTEISQFGLFGIWNRDDPLKNVYIHQRTNSRLPILDTRLYFKKIENFNDFYAT